MATVDVNEIALWTVNDYITDCRVLLQDTVIPYRYSDNELITALNLTILVARGFRADLFISSGDRSNHKLLAPQFVANDESCVDIDPEFRQAIEYGMAAHALLRDQEDIQDSRASTFYSLFTFLLTGTALPFIGKPQ